MCLGHPPSLLESRTTVSCAFSPGLRTRECAWIHVAAPIIGAFPRGAPRQPKVQALATGMGNLLTLVVSAPEDVRTLRISSWVRIIYLENMASLGAAHERPEFMSGLSAILQVYLRRILTGAMCDNCRRYKESNTRDQRFSHFRPPCRLVS